MRYFLFFLFVSICFSCNNKYSDEPQYKPRTTVFVEDDYEKIKADTISVIVFDTLELKFIKYGLVKIDSSIRVDLKYSSTDNFFGIDVYGNLTNAYLQPDVAQKLLHAQQFLRDINSDYSLLVYDAARPIYVQQIMWDSVKIPLHEKAKYLSNPKLGSLHNYGAAVDITIVDSAKIPLDMGTSYDYFGELAYPVKEQLMLQKGLLTQQQVDNRKLLRKVMEQAGFFNIQTEWWHFNSCTRVAAQRKYKLIE